MSPFSHKPDMLQNTSPAKDDSQKFENTQSIEYI